MGEIFNNLTTAQIDAKLHRDILEYQDRNEKILIVIAIILLITFRGWIGYWLKFGIAIPYEFTGKPIDVIQEPIQTDYTPEIQQKKTFTYKSLINDNQMELIPQAHYELSGTVVAFNHDFFFINKFFDSAALYDLGASWGKMSDQKFFKKYFKIYSQKVEFTGSRRLNWQWKYNTPLDSSYINSHISHTHIIPANNNIMAAMLKLKLYDKVKIEGELVDMNYYAPNRPTPVKYYTSLSRTDVDSSSRGSGACETLYVTKVQIGNFVYK